MFRSGNDFGTDRTRHAFLVAAFASFVPLAFEKKKGGSRSKSSLWHRSEERFDDVLSGRTRGTTGEDEQHQVDPSSESL